MPAFDYAAMADRAADLIARFGTTVTLRRTSGGTFNVATESWSGQSTADLTSTGIVKGFRADLIDGTRVQHGDRLLILDDSQAPQMTDKVVLGGYAWNIVDIETKSPAGTPLVYFVHIRA